MWFRDYESREKSNHSRRVFVSFFGREKAAQPQDGEASVWGDTWGTGSQGGHGGFNVRALVEE